jgi:serine/threonine-protein kinase HipA
MLGCHESESRTKSYWDLAASIRAHTPASMIKESQKELFGRMVFNILVTNDDDHLRNHAFLWDSKNKGWSLSPLYDVMPHPAVSFERNLHLSIGTQGRAATLDNALSGYANFGITFEDANQIIDRIWSVVREWKVYFESFGVPESEINKISTAFRHIDDVLSRNTLKK